MFHPVLGHAERLTHIRIYFTSKAFDYYFVGMTLRVVLSAQCRLSPHGSGYAAATVGGAWSPARHAELWLSAWNRYEVSVTIRIWFCVTDYVILDPMGVQQCLAEFGSHSSTSGLGPQQLPAALPVDLYGSARGSTTGANRVVYPAAHPAWEWQVARAIGTGDIYVVPGDVSSVEVDE